MSNGEYTLKELAEILEVRLKGDPNRIIRGIAPLEDACEDQLSFLTSKRYVHLVERSKAGAIIVDESYDHLDRCLLISHRPYLTVAKAAQLFAPLPALEPGISSLAFVDKEVEIGKDVAVGPFSYLGSGSRIGEGTKIIGSVYIGRRVSVGRDCLLYPHVTILDDCILGDRVIIHSGTVIGSDGFGFAQDESGHHVKIPQRGIVQIDDDVEIGANCTIDRATFGKTWIKKGCKIDNLVQIAHNVIVGEHSILVAQVGIAGSTTLGRHVVLGGKVGVGGHIQIADGVRVGGVSAIAHSVRKRQDLLGIPAVEAKEWFRIYAAIQRLPKLREDLKDLKGRLSTLEKILASLRNSL